MLESSKGAMSLSSSNSSTNGRNGGDAGSCAGWSTKGKAAGVLGLGLLSLSLLAHLNDSFSGGGGGMGDGVVGGLVKILGLLTGSASGAAADPGDAVYHRERLLLMDDPRRVRSTGMTTVWGEDLIADSGATPWPE